jgi:Zn-dependent metalloprotease
MRKILSLSLAFIFCSIAAFAQNSRQRDIDAFIAQTGAVATTDKATNSLNFLRFPIGQALNLEGGTPEQKAMAFLTKYPALFEKKTDKDSYQVKESKRDHYGLDHVTLQQYYDRVPVFDGVLKFHFNKDGGLTSLNGNFIIAQKLNATPSMSSEIAGQRAIQMVTGQKMGKFSAPLKINKNTLLVFQKGLAQGYKGALHLVYEVEVRNDADVREFLYIDAHTNELVEQFTGMHAIDRKLYETSVSVPNLKWQEADGIPSAKFTALDQWQKSEIESAGHMYNLMKNAFGRDSYDNAGAAMVTINNDPNVGCPNANWNGISANYCTGVASDDIVAHEWAHAYTEHTSGLIYVWQAGAMNEAYSDIWGETVDQLNGYFDTSESNALRNGCASSARWRIGEQASAFGGAIRDMWDPKCNNDPGKISDPQYWCSANDAGGVHSNSGILNHAYALLVDGGIYNGQMIVGLGLTKTAHLFWHAQAMHIANTTDFAAQADILEASLVELIGIDLQKLTTSEVSGGLSGIKFTASDLQQLTKVISAVEMRLENGCGFAKLFSPTEPLCKGAELENAFFFENFENGIGNWTVSNVGISPTWTPRNWTIDNSPPGGRTGKVAYGQDFNGGDCNTDLQNGLISIISPIITIPANEAGTFTMSFDHFISIQDGWDGGNLSYKIGAGAWQLAPQSAFTSNSYNTILFSGFPGLDSPLGGQPGFSGGNQGSLTSDWGQSRIDLSSLGLLAGQTIQFRWDLGTDGCGGWDGWYIDDVRVYSCSIPSIQFASISSSVGEGNATNPSPNPNSCLRYVEKKVNIKINKAPSQSVTITLNAPTGTATQGNNNDYEFSPNTFVLHAGQLSQDVVVKVYNDAYIEENETILLTFSISDANGGNAILESFNQQHTLTIVDNDTAPGQGSSEPIFSNFNYGLSSGWNVVGGGVYPNSWQVMDWGSEYSLDPTSTSLLAISSADGQGPMDKVIETPFFNSVGMSSIQLSFWEYFMVYPYDFPEQALVDVWDGASWHNLLTQSQATGTSGYWKAPALISIPIPIAYANPSMKIRFRYIADWDYWWLIDNVKVAATFNTDIQSALSPTPDSQYLGPNSTVYFYDPTSGDLIAKIKNLTAHDYGCTSVQVDRAGNDETAWIGTKNITKKTFKVNPTNDNLNGNYEITLYYKASELANFNGTDIKSMGKSEGGIQQATAANSLTAPVQMAAFNNDFAYTATFNSGFSGFGLSDAAAGGALPVTLVIFEGKHTSEGNGLVWETSSEVSNDHFVVERSRDATKFDEVARVAGVGNSTVRNAYSFTDSHYDKGINYYRLKQVDTDGSFAYSKMIAIESGGMREVKYFPNPVQSLLSIELPDTEMTECNVKVFNSAGQCVLDKERTKISKGKMSLDLAKLPAGVYQIVVSDDITTHNFSVVKIP